MPFALGDDDAWSDEQQRVPASSPSSPQLTNVSVTPQVDDDVDSVVVVVDDETAVAVPDESACPQFWQWLDSTCASDSVAAIFVCILTTYPLMCDRLEKAVHCIKTASAAAGGGGGGNVTPLECLLAIRSRIHEKQPLNADAALDEMEKFRQSFSSSGDLTCVSAREYAPLHDVAAYIAAQCPQVFCFVDMNDSNNFLQLDSPLLKWKLATKKGHDARWKQVREDMNDKAVPLQMLVTAADFSLPITKMVKHDGAGSYRRPAIVVLPLYDWRNASGTEVLDEAEQYLQRISNEAVISSILNDETVLLDGKSYKVAGVALYGSSHYTVVARFNDLWVYYDDMMSPCTTRVVDTTNDSNDLAALLHRRVVNSIFLVETKKNTTTTTKTTKTATKAASSLVREPTHSSPQVTLLNEEELRKRIRANAATALTPPPKKSKFAPATNAQTTKKQRQQQQAIVQKTSEPQQHTDKKDKQPAAMGLRNLGNTCCISPSLSFGHRTEHLLHA